jgi:hypothetical protein
MRDQVISRRYDSIASGDRPPFDDRWLTKIRLLQICNGISVFRQNLLICNENRKLCSAIALLVILLNVNIINNELSFKRVDFPIDLTQELAQGGKTALLCAGAWQQCCQ